MTDTLESYFQLSADRFFQALLDNPRCLMNVKGAVAEEHLALVLDGLKAKGMIAGYRRGGEGQPDFYVEYANRTVIVECKMVQKTRSRKRNSTPDTTTIDFKKTRTQNEGKHLRFYRPDAFDVVGACLFNRTGRWDFVYALTSTFPPHPTYPDRLWDKQPVLVGDTPLPNWSPDLGAVLKAV